jgi:hypothetical protein
MIICKNNAHSIKLSSLEGFRKSERNPDKCVGEGEKRLSKNKLSQRRKERRRRDQPADPLESSSKHSPVNKDKESLLSNSNKERIYFRIRKNHL